MRTERAVCACCCKKAPATVIQAWDRPLMRGLALRLMTPACTDIVADLVAVFDFNMPN